MQDSVFSNVRGFAKNTTFIGKVFYFNFRILQNIL